MIEHTPGEFRVTAQQDGFFVVPDRRPSGKDLVGNVDLLTTATTAPHECSDPQCPGNVNRLKVEACASLFCACTKLLAEYDGCSGPCEFGDRAIAETLIEGVRTAVGNAMQ